MNTKLLSFLQYDDARYNLFLRGTTFYVITGHTEDYEGSYDDLEFIEGNEFIEGVILEGNWKKMIPEILAVLDEDMARTFICEILLKSQGDPFKDEYIDEGEFYSVITERSIEIKFK